MGNIVDIYNAIKGFDIWEECLDILLEHREEIVQLNKDQLWDGKTTEGTDIYPDYLSDPYFKSAKSAERYARWKERITPNSNRNYKVPNFYITGKLVHNTLIAFRNGDVLEITPQGEAAGFDNKYKNIYGLTKENLALIKDKILPELQSRFKQKLGL